MTEEYKKILKEMLDENRYFHSVCVMEKAVELAKKYGGDIKKCETAGLLHDITKNLKREEQLKIFSDFGIMLTDAEKVSPKLWHAVSGAVYIEKILNIKDEEILSAVRYHTTAKKNMSLLEKIIFVADFTSEDRNYPDVEIIRNLADTSLDDAIIYGLRYTIKDLSENYLPIHPDTLEAYNYLLIEKKLSGGNL